MQWKLISYMLIILTVLAYVPLPSLAEDSTPFDPSWVEYSAYVDTGYEYKYPITVGDLIEMFGEDVPESLLLLDPALVLDNTAPEMEQIECLQSSNTMYPFNPAQETDLPIYNITDHLIVTQETKELANVYYVNPYMLDGVAQELESIFIKAGNGMYLVKFLTPLKVGEYTTFSIQNFTNNYPAISHFATLCPGFVPPGKIYSIISGYKFDFDASDIENGVNVPFSDKVFTFTIKDESDNVVGTAYSTPDGSLKFNDLGKGLTDQDTIELPKGLFTITEDMYYGYKVALNYIQAGIENPLMGSGDSITIDTNTMQDFTFGFYNERASRITGYKFNFNASDFTNGIDVPFADKGFSFTIKNSDGEVVATAYSAGDGSLKFKNLFNGIEDTDFLSLPEGVYTITEDFYLGYRVTRTELMVGEGPAVIGSENLITIDTSQDVDFAFKFYNTNVYFTKETAWALGPYSLNSLLGADKWGWYLPAATGEYPVYAGAGQNDLSKGTYIGKVVVTIENQYYKATFEPYDQHSVNNMHFGVYKSLTDLKKTNGAPGRFTNSVKDVDAKWMVIHFDATVAHYYDM